MSILKLFKQKINLKIQADNGDYLFIPYTLDFYIPQRLFYLEISLIEYRILRRFSSNSVVK